jgi:hypothetical protein
LLSLQDHPLPLVAGPQFGSGKSTLLAALVELLASARTRLASLPPELAPHLRVLVRCMACVGSCACALLPACLLLLLYTVSPDGAE